MSHIEVDTNANERTIVSRVKMCCAETGRVIGVFYNDYDANDIANTLNQLKEENKRLRDALKCVADWSIPDVFDDKENRFLQMAILYGSNAEKKYIRCLAERALKELNT